MSVKSTPPAQKAKELAHYLRSEHPDYNYLKQVFQHLRVELGVPVSKPSKKLPYVPPEEELKRFYEVVWHSKRNQDIVMIKTFLYTGVRVSELVKMRVADVDFSGCHIRINHGKGQKDRIVPFPPSFRDVLGMHANLMEQKNAVYLFESTWKKPYTDRGIRKIFEKYSAQAGLSHHVSPHTMRHFLFTWLKKQGLDDAFIQPYSGHANRQSLEVYSKLSLATAQEAYNNVIDQFPV